MKGSPPWVVGLALAGTLLGCEPHIVVGRADRPTSMRDASAEDADLEDAPTADAADASAAPRRVTWPSGAHVGNDPQSLLDFGQWRGRPLDVVMFFVDRTVGWTGLVAPAWPVDMLADFQGRLVLSVPLYPEGQGSNAECATGAYDAHWEQLGPFLSGRGRGDSIIRLGWGPNDATHPWRADPDPDDWISCFRQVVDALRRGGPDLEVAWDFDPPGRPEDTGLDPLSTYPGDAYVDYVGLEHFDYYDASTDRAAWQRRCDGPTGLCSLITFARRHGKHVGLSEWGVVGCDDAGGGDNPLFVDLTLRTLADAGDVVGFEAYYDASVDLCPALFSQPSVVPESAARYLSWFEEP